MVRSIFRLHHEKSTVEEKEGADKEISRAGHTGGYRVKLPSPCDTGVELQTKVHFGIVFRTEMHAVSQR